MASPNTNSPWCASASAYPPPRASGTEGQLAALQRFGPGAGFHVRLAKAEVNVKFWIGLVVLGQCGGRGEQCANRKDGTQLHFHNHYRMKIVSVELKLRRDSTARKLPLLSLEDQNAGRKRWEYSCEIGAQTVGFRHHSYNFRSLSNCIEVERVGSLHFTNLTRWLDTSNAGHLIHCIDSGASVGLTTIR